MRKKSLTGRLMDVALFTFIVLCTTISWVLTSDKAVATHEPLVKKEFIFQPANNLDILIDLTKGKVMQLQSDAAIKDLSVQVNHPEVEPEIKTVTELVEVLVPYAVEKIVEVPYEPFPRLKFSQLPPKKTGVTIEEPVLPLGF